MGQEVRRGMAGMMVPAPSPLGPHPGRADRLEAGIHLKLASLICLVSGL